MLKLSGKINYVENYFLVLSMYKPIYIELDMFKRTGKGNYVGGKKCC